MSYFVTRLVRAMRLPRTMVHRPAAKGILLALADDCADDGGGAFTSIATLAREAEVSPRTVNAHLSTLRRAGLILEQQRPTQHRPRTWQLSLAALAALADPHAVAALPEADRQLVTALNREPCLPFESDLQSGNPATQIGTPATQPVAPERYEQREQREYSGADAAMRSRLAKEPNGDNFHVIQPLAVEVLKATGLRGFDLIEEVKQRCADLRIDYGRHEAVPFNVVHRACAWAELQVLKATHAIVREPRRRRRPMQACR